MWSTFGYDEFDLLSPSSPNPFFYHSKFTEYSNLYFKYKGQQSICVVRPQINPPDMFTLYRRNLYIRSIPKSIRYLYLPQRIQVPCTRSPTTIMINPSSILWLQLLSKILLPPHIKKFPSCVCNPRSNYDLE